MGAFNPPNLAPQSDDRELELLRLLARYFYDARTGAVPLQINSNAAQASSAVVIGANGAQTSYPTAADTDSARGAALEAARDAATAGDLVLVSPGAYTVASSLAKNGVNWHFEAGAVVTREADVDGGVWDDGGAAVATKVTGAGVFNRTRDTGSELEALCILCSHANSVMEIEASAITVTLTGAESGNCYAVYQTAGDLRIRAHNITANGANSGYGAWWSNGRMHLHVGVITGENNAGLDYAYYSWVEAAPTGDAYLVADEINGRVVSAGTNADAATWVECKILRGSATDAVQVGTNKLYVHAQKVFGLVRSVGPGQGYVVADKVSATRNGAASTPSLFYATTSGASVRMEVLHWDQGAFTGETIKVTNGTIDIRGGDLVIEAATAKGVEITGGTLLVTGMRINTVASTTTNPVTKTGGTLKMYHSTLVSQGARDAIEGGTGQTVSLMGCFSNNALDAQVTNDITGGLITDAQVA
jgi:hypothetical protein